MLVGNGCRGGNMKSTDPGMFTCREGAYRGVCASPISLIRLLLMTRGDWSITRRFAEKPFVAGGFVWGIARRGCRGNSPGGRVWISVALQITLNTIKVRRFFFVYTGIYDTWAYMICCWQVRCICLAECLTTFENVTWCAFGASLLGFACQSSIKHESAPGSVEVHPVVKGEVAPTIWGRYGPCAQSKGDLDARFFISRLVPKSYSNLEQGA